MSERSETEIVGAILVPIAQLRPNPSNPRRVSDAQFQHLCASLQSDPDFLWQRPILATADGRVFAGNLRLRAAQHLGWRDIPAILCDIPAQLARERSLVDNNQFGTWAEDELAALLDDLERQGSQVGLLGFDEQEVQQLLDLARADESVPADPGPDRERACDLEGEWQTEQGQLWVVESRTLPGRVHRLLCADPSNLEAIERVMDGARAGLFATVAESGVAGTGRRRSAKAQRKARARTAEMVASFDAVLGAAKTVALVDKAAWYMWHQPDAQAAIEAAWNRQDVIVHQHIVWVMDQGTATGGWYRDGHKSCLFGWLRGQKPRRVAKDRPTTVWPSPPEAAADRSDLRPAALFATPMRQHTVVGDICYEPFCGDGAQIVAAEQAGRVCHAIEQDPQSVAETLERLVGIGLIPRLQ